MQASHHHLLFWAGVALLAVALLCLTVMDMLARWLGIFGMGAWLLPTVAGVYLIMRVR